MGDHDPSAAPAGLAIEAVDWLPSGGRSGLVRVRGRWDDGPEEIPLPDLVVGPDRFTSLPDPRAGRERGAWRGAYVVPAAAVEAPDARLIVEFPGGVRIALPRPSQSFTPSSGDSGADVVDRAVLADRRARRAEAAEQAQARIAREALKAVEVLELRAAELEERLDAARAAPPVAAAPDPLPAPVPAPVLAPAPTPDERLREALASAIATAGDLRLQLHEARVRSRTSEIAHAAESVRLAVLHAERSAVSAEVHALRRRLAAGEQEAVAHAETRRLLDARVAEILTARDQLAALEAELAHARAEAQRVRTEELPAALAAQAAELSAAAAVREAELVSLREAAEAGIAERDAELLALREGADRAVAAQQAELVALREQAERAAATRDTEAAAAIAAARAEVERIEASLAHAETGRSVAQAEAAGAIARAQAADVARASLAELLARHGAADDPGVLAELDRLRDELTAARAEIRAQSARLAATETLATDLERMRAELAAERASAGVLRTELAAAAAQSAEDGGVVAALTAEIDAATARTQAERVNTATLAEQLAAERERVAAVAAELAAEREQASALASELAAEREQASALAAELAAEREQASALAGELAAERERAAAVAAEVVITPAPPPATPAPPPVAPALPERAAEQEEAAAAAEPAPDRDRIVADLAAAAEALRARTPVPAPFAEEPAPRGPTIISAPDAPRSVATGRDAREYPALRGALVKLAHDDGAAAARLLAGLLPAQWRVLDEPVDYDITIAEVGTFACTVTAGGAKIRPLAGARGRSEAEFHLKTDALTLAEMLAGVGPRPRRLGRARVSGRARRAKVLRSIPLAAISLPDAVRAGATLEPELVLRTLAYAVHPSWTKGHEFTIAHTFVGPEGDETLFITAAGSGGLRVSHDPPAETPRATVVITRRAFAAMLGGEAPPPGERPATRGDHRAAQTLRAWADRARAGA